jgi:hypothetical protein
VVIRKVLPFGVVACATSALLAQTPQYLAVKFADLANYSYNAKEPWASTPHVARPSGIPPQIWWLDGQRVAVLGSLMPINWDTDGSSEFILMVSQDMCGFGAIPRLNESIHVVMKNRVQKRLFQGAEYQVKGVLHIKEEIEDDLVVGLYSIDGDNVE